MIDAGASSCGVLSGFDGVDDGAGDHGVLPQGVSTRRMNDSVATLGISNMSQSQVPRMSEELDEMVADFKNRLLDAGGYAYLSCDALTIKVREGGRVVKCFSAACHWGQRRRLP